MYKPLTITTDLKTSTALMQSLKKPPPELSLICKRSSSIASALPIDTTDSHSRPLGGKSYKGPDVQIADNGSNSGRKHFRVKIHSAESDGVYGLSRTLSVARGSVYILQYAWKRTCPEDSGASSMQTPRLRITFRDNEGKPALYKGKTALWYETSSTAPQTDWVVEQKILRIETDSDIHRLNITFHFATRGQNSLDNIQLLQF